MKSRDVSRYHRAPKYQRRGSDRLLEPWCDCGPPKNCNGVRNLFVRRPLGNYVDVDSSVRNLISPRCHRNVGEGAETEPRECPERRVSALDCLRYVACGFHLIGNQVAAFKGLNLLRHFLDVRELSVSSQRRKQCRRSVLRVKLIGGV